MMDKMRNACTEHSTRIRCQEISLLHQQIGVDIFVLAQTYVDVASLGQLCRTTGGQLYNYGKFDARSDTAQLFNDLRWSLIRPQARRCGT